MRVQNNFWERTKGEKRKKFLVKTQMWLNSIENNDQWNTRVQSGLRLLRTDILSQISCEFHLTESLVWEIWRSMENNISCDESDYRKHKIMGTVIDIRIEKLQRTRKRVEWRKVRPWVSMWYGEKHLTSHKMYLSSVTITSFTWSFASVWFPTPLNTFVCYNF